MFHRLRAASWLLLVGLGVTPVVAQTDDPQTRDHEERDRLYLERLKQAEKAPARQPEETSQDAFLRKAEELVRDRNYRSATGKSYRVQTDDPRLDPAAAAALLDAFRGFFTEFWADRLELAPYEDTARVFLFYSFYKYNQLLEGDFRFSQIRPKGHYGSTYDAITLHTDGGSLGNLPATLIHEAAHQLVDQRFAFEPGPAPTWLAEGLASYFGYMERDRDGTFRPERVGDKSASLQRDGNSPRSTEATGRRKDLRNGLRGRAADDSLAQRLLWMRDPGDFYGSPDQALHYAASWGLVHTLLHGDDGRHARAFCRWIERERTGDGGPQALLDELGLDVSELDAALARHAKKM